MDPSEYQDYFQKKVTELQKETMQNIQNKNTAPTQPIRMALNLLDQRINKLQDVCDRLAIGLQLITSNSDEKYPIEKVAREGNSDLNCSPYENDRPVILAVNEGGYCATRVDLIQLLEWVRDNMPELMTKPSSSRPHPEPAPPG